MIQQSFSDVAYTLPKRMTKRKEFWDVMDEIIPVGRVDRLHQAAFFR